MTTALEPVAPERPNPIRVVLAPDSAMFATGLAATLADFAALDVVVAESIDALGTAMHGGAIVVMQPGFFPGSDPVRVVQGLSRCPDTSSIVLTAEASEELHIDLIAAGGAGTFPLHRSARDLATAIAMVAGGGRLGYDAHHLTPNGRRRALARGLSRREHEVLELLAQGCSNRAIGEALFVSIHTARHHVQAVLEKLGAHSRVKAVAIAVRDGLVDAPR